MNAVSLVSTIKQKCKRCYSCVRGCPAKAIRVMNGQAVVIGERCIGCGHCVKVCSQNAKLIYSDIEETREYLADGNAYAIIAPSYAASFDDADKAISAIKALGFVKVIETAFGADLISKEYTASIESGGDKVLISSTCPAVVNLVEKFYEKLVSNLSEIVSPMIAAGRYLKQIYGSDIRVVFIGPCIAKKSETWEDENFGVIDEVITFKEIKELIAEAGIDIAEMPPAEPDLPHALYGKSFPLSGGLLKSSALNCDILSKDIITVEGRNKTLEIMDELESGKLSAKLVDVLFCEGCISGPAMDSDLSFYKKREKLLKHIENKLEKIDKTEWEKNISVQLNLKRSFYSKKQRRPVPPANEINDTLRRINKPNKEDELNCGACGYDTCREFAIAIGKELAEEEMCLPYLIDKLEKAYEDLKITQEQLHSAEKLASIGQLAAGIAHEINNPLGSIMLYSSMLKKDLERRMGEEYSEDLSIIVDEAKRCKNIVSDLLNFAKQRKVFLKSFDVFELIQQTIKILAINPVYSDIQIIPKKLTDDSFIQGDEDQLKEVFINLLNNACDAMEDVENKKIDIGVYGAEQFVAIEIRDYGSGIEKENLKKLFTPFFTTKKMGKGTGLGLAISYGIVKMHNGEIYAANGENGGAVFTMKLPRAQNKGEYDVHTLKGRENFTC